MSRADQPQACGSAVSDVVARWWTSVGGNRELYDCLRQASAADWEAASATLTSAATAERPAPPDRATARVADLPELQAFRVALQDDRAPFDTIDRWLRSLTQMAQALHGRRPIAWSADDVAERCVGLAQGDAGSIWSTLEAIRAFWRWHPEQAYIEREVARLRALLSAAAAAGRDA